MHKLETTPSCASVDEAVATNVASRSRSPLTFFVLVLVLSLPFWLIGAVTSFQVVPGASISALMFVCPVTAAALLVYQENKGAGVNALLARSIDVNRVAAKTWYVPIILLEPGIKVVSYSTLRLMGVPVPAPQFSVIPALALFAVFFISAVGEELGWSGYVLEPLQQRCGALGGALLLGGVGAVWHVVPLIESQRSLAFIAWWSLGTVASRVIITWLYNTTGRSVFAAAIYHTMANLTWQLFPINGSWYDPRVTSVITAAVAVVVVTLYGPRTLIQARNTWRSAE